MNTIVIWNGALTASSCARLSRDEEGAISTMVARHVVKTNWVCLSTPRGRQDEAVDAVETLRGVMLDKEAPDTARVNAAQLVLDLAIQSASADLIARVEALEIAIKKLRRVA